MSLDKFPEAFDRFERSVNVDNIESFRQLTLVFACWAGPKWRYTRRQMEALALEAQRIGIPVYGGRRERRIHHFPSAFRMTWRHEAVIVRGSSQDRYRDLKTGRFMKKP